MEFPLPQLGEGVYEAELVRWFVQPGDTVKRGQTLCEVMTDKATMEVPSPFIGTIKSLNCEAGQTVKVGQVVLTYDGTPLGTNEPTKTPEVTVTKSIPTPVSDNGVSISTAVKAAPSVRHLARKLGIDLTRVRGTGPGGRILIDDLTTALPTTKLQTTSVVPPALDVGVAGSRIKMVGLRRKIAERMVESKRAIPHYTYIDEVDVTDLVKLRSLATEHYLQTGIKLTYLPFFIRAAVRALREVPIVNSTFDESTNEIILHDRYDLGLAVATPGGLVVPVIRGADKLSIGQLAREIDRLSTAARAGKSKREDLSGGTFTITSIGGIGGLISTPIINHPEVAILGIGKVVKRPVYDDAGNIRPAEMVYLSISFDHRIVDGAIGALFGNALVKHLRQPGLLLLDPV